jgi:elongation factor P
LSVSTNDFKNGMTLELDGTLFQIIEFQHVKPGKGGAFVRSKLRNVKTGAVTEKTFNAGVKVGLAIVERKDMQYLYGDGSDYVFMDLDTYEQIHVPAALVGEAANYLVEGAQAQVSSHEGVPIAVDLPASIVLTISKTDPGAKGDTRTGASKPATLETGIVVNVPLFVEELTKSVLVWWSSGTISPCAPATHSRSPSRWCIASLAIR